MNWYIYTYILYLCLGDHREFKRFRQLVSERFCGSHFHQNIFFKHKQMIQGKQQKIWASKIIKKWVLNPTWFGVRHATSDGGDAYDADEGHRFGAYLVVRKGTVWRRFRHSSWRPLFRAPLQAFKRRHSGVQKDSIQVPFDAVEKHTVSLERRHFLGTIGVVLGAVRKPFRGPFRISKGTLFWRHSRPRSKRRSGVLSRCGSSDVQAPSHVGEKHHF